MEFDLGQHPRFEAGRVDAEQAIARDRLGYRVSGKVDWQLCEEAAAILRDTFGVHPFVDGHSIVPIEQAASDEGYNSRMREESSARFGEDVIEVAFRQAERKLKKSRRRGKPEQKLRSSDEPQNHHAVRRPRRQARD